MDHQNFVATAPLLHASGFWRPLLWIDTYNRQDSSPIPGFSVHLAFWVRQLGGFRAIYPCSAEFQNFAAHFAFLRGISNFSVEVRISTQNLRMIWNICGFNAEIANVTERSGFLDNICERSEEFRNSTLNSWKKRRPGDFCGKFQNLTCPFQIARGISEFNGSFAFSGQRSWSRD